MGKICSAYSGEISPLQGERCKHGRWKRFFIKMNLVNTASDYANIFSQERKPTFDINNLTQLRKRRESFIQNAPISSAFLYSITREEWRRSSLLILVKIRHFKVKYVNMEGGKSFSSM
ncbi:hypothetical protein CEXT_368121 [Caerostris extrusa]|uniref:Uncharacterized protein n=1 Tax=Caerostris extrusa TaxID=172846 RepID=A0AAV4UUC3_CAEEX|nr:hypothetical protein CEXT_368121 [Caerostris extrusa]